MSIKNGIQPRWNAKGDELFYIEVSSNSLMAVSVETEPTVTLGTPVKLFEARTPGVALQAGYDVAPDGQRFLTIQVTDPEAGAGAIAVIENWFAEFKDRP